MCNKHYPKELEKELRRIYTEYSLVKAM